MITLILPHLYLNKIYNSNELKASYIEHTSKLNSLDIIGFCLAYGIKTLQGTPFVVSFLGGNTGKHIRSTFSANKLGAEFIFTRSNTELKATICDNEKHFTIDGNVKPISDKEYMQYKHKLCTLNSNSNVVLIDEHFFKANEVDFLKDVLKLYSANHFKILFNAKHIEMISEYMDIAVPYTIKLCINKMDKLWSESVENIAEELKVYLVKGVHYLVIEIAERGILFVSKHKICFFNKLEYSDNKIYNQALEGFLGALAVGIERKYEFEKICKLCISTFISIIKHNGLLFCSQKDILQNKNKNKLEEIKKSE